MLIGAAHLMSEEETMDQVQQVPGAAFSAATAGVLLKTAREAQGLHIGALAVMLKVPVRKLEALEADRHEALGDLVFTRALAASVCRVLKIDPASVLAALPHSEIRPMKTDESGLNTPFRAGGVVSGQLFKSRLTSPMGLAVALLLLGILLLVMWPEREAPDLVPISGLPTHETEVFRPEPAVDAPVAPAPALQASDVPLTLAPVAMVQVAPAAPVESPSGGPAILSLQSRGSSWVEVTDAQGVVQLRKILEPGEEVRLQGPLPLLVVLGRADEIDVRVRGERLDLSSVTRTNVARFEVK